MVICNLKGGLGNQMFQYAFAKSLAAKKDVIFDLSFLKKHNKSTNDFVVRSFELGIFKNIKIRTVNILFLRFLLSKNPNYNFIKLFLPSKLRDLEYLDDNNCEDYQSEKSVYLSGYFQNPRLFDQIREKLLADFQFPELPPALKNLENAIRLENAISIHVRRGDYLDNETMSFHGILPLSYYQKAVSHIKDKIDCPHFFIFSDDINWCKANFSFISTAKTFVSGYSTKHWIDMYLISACKHHIIANSTFSWWGAWLGTYTDKLVIAPKNWFKNSSSEIIPHQWTTL